MNDNARVIIEKLKNKYRNDADAFEEINRAKISLEYHNETNNICIYKKFKETGFKPVSLLIIPAILHYLFVLLSPVYLEQGHE